MLEVKAFSDKFFVQVMIRSYIKTAIRNFFRDKGYALINVLGLAIGMTCALFIGLYVWDELRFDNFHSNKNLYRVALHRTFPANETYYATSPAPLTEVLTNEYPEVIKATRLFKIFGELRVREQDEIFFEPNALAADSNFFDLFSIRMLEGNPKEALQQRNSVVLTKSMALKYFGVESALGKQLSIFSDTTTYLVTGITEDVPDNCHFTFDLLLSFTSFQVSESNSWAGYNVYSYIILDKPESKETLERKLPNLVEQYFGPEVQTILGKKYEEYFAAGNHHNYHLQPVRDIHLHSNYQYELKPNGDVRYIYLFSAVCFFILLLAGVNFTNLSTARSFRRAKEIGVRKVHGSKRSQLVFQFLTESVLVSLLSMIIAISLIILLLNNFNDFTAKNISIADLNPLWVFVVLLSLLLFNGIIAGIYPALIISGLNPIRVLKGKLKSGRSKSYLRNSLVVIQFGVSVVLIISTLVIYKQLAYMREKKLGFDKDNILVLERANLLGTQRLAFNEEIRLIPGVKALGSGFSVPGRQFTGSTFQATGAEATERINHASSFCDFYLPTSLGLEFVVGRTFSEDIAGDSLAVVVNEALVKRVGWKSAEEAIGQRIRPVFDLQNQYEIIGVVKDFNFQSLNTAIEPHAFYGSNTENYNALLAVVQLQKGINIKSVLSMIEKKWQRFLPAEQFEYTFLGEEFDNQYRQEERFGKIFGLFSGLAIFIASIGVIGLSTFMASQRTKEIGIRKVVGASASTLLLLLLKDFLKLVVLANIIFWPVAWYGLSQWLSNYPFHTDLNPVLFIATGIATAVMVMFSIAWQSLKATLANPVKSLRSE